MFRFIQAILMGIMRIFQTTAQSIWDAFDWSIRTSGRLIDAAVSMVTGGGGVGPAPPVKDMKAALPQIDTITQARELAEGEGKAAEIINRQSPAQQAMTFAMMSEDDRMSADLSLLSDDQIDWLNGLSEGQLRSITDATEQRVTAALAGEPKALVAIRSVNEPEPEAETILGTRIAAFRAGNLALDRPMAFALH
ncbi:hypothetical protein LJR098_001052 [Rhizobium sp. LjRoot98]|uniref:hypothetical protein n=1 Tax=Rhizobium sp. LjRoot98 TaxID=3342345 RepID=UPI003ECE6687